MQKNITYQNEELTNKTILKLQYTVKKVIVFLVPIRDATKQDLTGRELLNYSLAGTVWLGTSTSRLGTGKTITFLQCMGSFSYNII
jgi:hypothetical protein